MDGIIASIELTFDEDYYAEFHREWVASQGRNFRYGRIIVAIAFASSVAAFAIGALKTNAFSMPIGAALMVFASLVYHELFRRKRQWLAHVRTLPWHGRHLRLVLRNDGLFQQKDLDGDPRYVRTGEITTTPNGYLVRYVATSDVSVPSDAISNTKASVYIAHRRVVPPIRREDFLSRARAAA